MPSKCNTKLLPRFCLIDAAASLPESTELNPTRADASVLSGISLGIRPSITFITPPDPVEPNRSIAGPFRTSIISACAGCTASA